MDISTTALTKLDNNKQTVELFSKTLGELFRINIDGNKCPYTYECNEPRLVIPDYQRIYCWAEKNVFRLLDDIKFSCEGKKKFHLGNIILQNTKINKESVYAIVDGQQRLVTLALVCMFLSNDIYISLLDERFESAEAQNYVAFNKTLIKNYSDKLKVEERSELIKYLFEKIIFSVLIINEDSLDLAYTFFSNQNSRGKPLSDYNLLKAHHLRFINEEEQARHLAQRWDNLLLDSENVITDKNLKRTLGIYLFRLRKWMRKSDWNDEEKYKIKTEFEAADTLPEIPPFGEKFIFNESIQGGAHFFAYTDHFIYRFKTFKGTEGYLVIQILNRETHWWYKDAIETLLFAYYLKFGTMYFSEALFCIEQIISEHRYSHGRSSLGGVLNYTGESEIVMMLDQASSPTFFLAEILNKIKKIPQKGELFGIRNRYQRYIANIHESLSEHIQIETIKKIMESKKIK